MSLFAYLNGSLVGTSYIRLGAVGGLPAAADGTGSQGSIVFDDPSGNLTVTGWQIVKVIEADCASAPILFYGTVADRTYRRGPYRQGASREIDTTINDHNGFLSLRLLGGDGPSRPAETDTQRLAWLLSDASLSGLVYDLGFVNGTGLPFDAANLQGMYPADVLNDLASHYGQIFFTYWDQSAQKVGLFFDFPSATTFTSTLSVSNVLSDITFDANKEPTGTVYPPHIDGELIADPSEVYSRIRFKYTGGVVWRTNATTEATFFPLPLDYRSLQVENDRIGKATTATTFADRILTADSAERIVVSFTVRLPSTKVGLIQAGMRIHLTFTHLPGFETGAYSRIERINIIPTDGDPTHYDVHCECSTSGLTTATGSGGGSTDPFPSVPPSTTPTIIQQKSGAGNIIMDNPIGSGNTLIYATTARGSSIAVGGFNFITAGYTLAPDGESNDPGGTNTAAVYYRHTDGTEDQHLGGGIGSVPTQELNGTWYEIEGTWDPDTHDETAAASTTVSTPSIAVQANSFNVVVVAQGQGGAYDSVAGTLTYTPAAGWTEDFDSYNPAGGHPNVLNLHRVNTGAGSISGGGVNSGNGGLSGTDYDFIAQIVSFTGGASTNDPPTSGKPWGPILPNETPDGATTSFTMPTGYTWAEGSLKVFVQKLDQTLAITAEDGAAGTFTLGFAPKTGWLVEVYGQAL